MLSLYYNYNKEPPTIVLVIIEDPMLNYPHPTHRTLHGEGPEPIGLVHGWDRSKNVHFYS